MGEVDSWESEKFREVFDDEMRGLNRRMAHDPSCPIEELEGILDSLYALSDRNSEGRVQEIVFQATIAAYEAFIHARREKEK